MKPNGPRQDHLRLRAVWGRAADEVFWFLKAFRACLLPPSCRYAPTCSEYAHEAVGRHGAVRGTALAFLRVMRCHPFRPGGYDPVP